MKIILKFLSVYMVFTCFFAMPMKKGLNSLIKDLRKTLKTKKRRDKEKKQITQENGKEIELKDMTGVNGK